MKTRRTRLFTATIAAIAGGVVGVAPVHATQLGINLIENPGAEIYLDSEGYETTAETDLNSFGDRQLARWDDPMVDAANNRLHGMAVEGYAWDAPDTPRWEQIDASFGKNLFIQAWANGENTTSISQTIALTDEDSLFGQIDAGGIKYTMSGYLGGILNDPTDYGWLLARFLDGGGAELGSRRIGNNGDPFENNAGEPGGVMGFDFFQAMGVLPPGTRDVGIQLFFTKNGSTEYGNGGADNLFFSLSVPEPATAGMLSSLSLLALVRRRRRHT